MQVYLSILGHKVTFKKGSTGWSATTHIALRFGAEKNHWCCAFGDTPAKSSDALSQCIEWKADAMHSLTLDTAHHEVLCSLKRQLYLIDEIELERLVAALDPAVLDATL